MNYNCVCEEGDKGARADADEFWIDGNGCAHQTRQRLAMDALEIRGYPAHKPSWMRLSFVAQGNPTKG